MNVVVIDECFAEYAFGHSSNGVVGYDNLFAVFGVHCIKVHGFSMCMCTVFGYAPAFVNKAQPASQAGIVPFGPIA